LAKTSAVRVPIPLDLSSRPVIPFPRFIRSRRPASVLAAPHLFWLFFRRALPQRHVLVVNFSASYTLPFSCSSMSHHSLKRDIVHLKYRPFF
jgi:hypothetical protein